MTRLLALTALLLLTAFPPLTGQQRDLRVEIAPTRRVALVIGNNEYEHAPALRNAANDANDLGSSLEKMDFEVEVLVNADLRTLNGAINSFISRIEPGDVALFHYSGHGMQVGGENFLIPVDFQLTDEASVRYDAYSASKLHDRLAGAGSKLTIVTLDACRNNGFETSRSTSGGLAGMNAAEGAFIAFATGPGMTADDNLEGRNGLFTGELLKALDQPGLTLDEVFNEVRRGVYLASGRQQLPWSSSSVIGGFYFRTPQETTQPVSVTTGGAPAIPPDQAWRLELAFWEAIRDGDNPAMFESYLGKYPDGNFAELARIKLADLESVPEPKPAPEPAAAVQTAPPAPKPEPQSQPAASNSLVDKPSVTERPAEPAPKSTQAAAPAPKKPQISVDSLPLMGGNLGVRSRVARNIEELQILAASGDRNYSVFALPVSETPQGIGTAGWKLQLTATDAASRRFTLYTLAPGETASTPKRRTLLDRVAGVLDVNSNSAGFEHKNAEAYQPIQFRRTGPNVCDEIVILSIESNRVVGYLAESR